MAIKHGRWKTAEYKVWISIKQRCFNPKCRTYPLYGGRGISMAAEWRSDFAAFLAYVGERPSAGHSIDRIDNERGYEPGNLQWVTMRVQMRNTRRTRLFTHEGETMCITDWAHRLGVHPQSLTKRLAKWPIEQALTHPRLGNGYRNALLPPSRRGRSRLVAESKDVGR